jgi:hypothetical protein
LIGSGFSDSAGKLLVEFQTVTRRTALVGLLGKPLRDVVVAGKVRGG